MTAPRPDWQGSPDWCGKTDAVLALYLDGDIGGGDAGRIDDPEESGFDLVCPDTLARHLRDCPTCQVALQRARRLDAVLAESAGRVMASTQGARTPDARTPDDGAARRMFAAVERRAAAPLESDDSVAHPDAANATVTVHGVGAQPNQRRLRAREMAVWMPACLLAAAASGLASLWLFQAPPAHDAVHTIRATAASPNTTTTEPAVATVESAAPDGGAPVEGTPAEGTPVEESDKPVLDIAAPEAAIGDLPRRTGGIRIAIDAVRRVNSESPRRQPEELRSETRRAEPDLDELAARLADASLPAGERIAAATNLVQKSRPGTAGASAALAKLVQTLAASRGDADGLACALVLAAGEPHFTGYLRATLRRMEPTRTVLTHEDLAALTVASRIGSGELDTAVRRVLRRHDDGLEVVAAALRLPVRPRGGAALLLACWGDVARRDSVDGSVMAASLFAGQPRPMFTELRELLEQTSSVPGRVQCLLALASCTEPQSTATLLEWATASCREEAYAAAWSLSRLPHAWLEQAAARVSKDRDAFLLRAALACADLPAAKSWTDPMHLTPSERVTIAKATFAVFPRLAEWFRDGPAARFAIAHD